MLGSLTVRIIFSNITFYLMEFTIHLLNFMSQYTVWHLRPLTLFLRNLSYWIRGSPVLTQVCRMATTMFLSYSTWMLFIPTSKDLTWYQLDTSNKHTDNKTVLDLNYNTIFIWTYDRPTHNLQSSGKQPHRTYFTLCATKNRVITFSRQFRIEFSSYV